MFYKSLATVVEPVISVTILNGMLVSGKTGLKTMECKVESRTFSYF